MISTRVSVTQSVHYRVSRMSNFVDFKDYEWYLWQLARKIHWAYGKCWALKTENIEPLSVEIRAQEETGIAAQHLYFSRNAGCDIFREWAAKVEDLIAEYRQKAALRTDILQCCKRDHLALKAEFERGTLQETPGKIERILANSVNCDAEVLDMQEEETSNVKILKSISDMETDSREWEGDVRSSTPGVSSSLSPVASLSPVRSRSNSLRVQCSRNSSLGVSSSQSSVGVPSSLSPVPPLLPDRNDVWYLQRSPSPPSPVTETKDEEEPDEPTSYSPVNGVPWYMVL
jgi:hypothetical protein